MKNVMSKVSRINEYVVELKTMPDLIKEARAYENKTGKEFYSKFQNARSILNELATMKYDGKHEESLLKIQKQIQDLGLSPIMDLDMAIMDLESVADVIATLPSLAKRLDNPFPGVDISGYK